MPCWMFSAGFWSMITTPLSQQTLRGSKANWKSWDFTSEIQPTKTPNHRKHIWDQDHSTHQLTARSLRALEVRLHQEQAASMQPLPFTRIWTRKGSKCASLETARTIRIQRLSSSAWM